MAEQRKRTPVWEWITGTRVLLPLLYLMSIGPAEWLRANGYLIQSAAKVLFHFDGPVKFLRNCSELFRTVFDWYLSFWTK